MELKVWVEGIQRIVCGVTVNTTCQDVVFALAHATGKVGRFTLIERWRNNERLLAPNENPLKLLLKWGEYANDVQFILQRSEQMTLKTQQQQPQRMDVTSSSSNSNNNNNERNSQTHAVMKKPLALSNNNNSNNNEMHNMDRRQQQENNELRKSFGAHDAKQLENIGIVKGIPQRLGTGANSPQQPAPSVAQLLPKHEKSHSNPIEMSSTPSSNNNNNINNNNNNNENNNFNSNNIYAQIGAKSKSTNEINLSDVRTALDRRTVNDSAEIMFSNIANAASNDNLLDIFNGNYNGSSSNSTPDQQQQLYKNVTPTISANGALVPPPYRDPPPPRISPLQYTKANNNSNHESTPSQSSPVCQNCNGALLHEMHVCGNPFVSDYNNFDLDGVGGGGGVVAAAAVAADESESIFQATQYNDLLALIKFQREKISKQQSELSKYDAEIVYLESKERDQAQELEAISREITKADQIFRQGSEQLQTLQYVEEENELVKQQEKTLKSEIALLRSKLANCETELLQCKNKIRILMDDIEVEQRAISNKQKSNRQNVERDFLIEMERIQTEIDQAIHNTDTSNKTTENLKKEILLIENAIADKKRQVELLVNEMKEVNLQSLTVTTSEEIKHLLEGSNKPGSSRRIIGSPRQLENAVPTSKNPHGVWV